ncbi:Bug family tripartite tricarboxylate transporter substrate binding protein [Rhodovarius crocodyli]|nr:tripartite tricarboxylate transporter substrate binding protein [Rhodovarius crocodyli]
MIFPRRALLGAPLLAFPALAQEGYPNRPIRYISPYPPGATNDNTSRLMSRALTQRLGVPVVVENRAGAGGSVGSRLVAGAAPDGYTLLNVSAGNLTVVPHLGHAGYDPLRDFTPVALTGDSFSLFAVHPSLPVRNIAELVAYAKANPGKLNYSSAGIGTAGHFRGALLAEEAGIDIVHVPFPGSAPAANALVAGDVHMMFDPIAAPHVRGGRARAIAVFGDGRWDEFGDVPNAVEQGVGLEWPSVGWFGLFAPARTPAHVVETLNAHFNAALEEPEVVAALLRFGLRPRTANPAELGERVRREHAAVGDALRRLHIA